MNIILIDGYNFLFRSYWEHKLVGDQNQRVEIVFNTFKNIINLHKTLSAEINGKIDRIAFCWDAGYKDRLDYSKKAVMNKIIPSTYKSKRRIQRKLEKQCWGQEEIEEEEFRKEQIEMFKKMLYKTCIDQIVIKNEEADDVIASYSKKYKDDKIIIVSSDKDYYQLVNDNVSIYNAQGRNFVTSDSLYEEFKFCSQDTFIEYGVLTGDTSDTIHGVRGWGPKTAKEYLMKHGTVDNIIKHIKQNPFYKQNQQHFESNTNIDRTKRIVAGIKSKLKAKEFDILFNDDVITVARYLKTMRCNLPVPELKEIITKPLELENEWKDLGFKRINQDIDLLLNEPYDSSKVSNLLVKLGYKKETKVVEEIIQETLF